MARRADADDRRRDAPSRRDHRALRFLTAGSVDDGKSTLIGRLLFDSRAILADQLDTLREARRRRADRPVAADRRPRGRARARHHDRRRLPLLRDPQRKFIIADAPGHEQYTRNMVTAAAGSDAAVVLVDITKLDLARAPVALLPQTRRHALLAQLLRVPSIVFAVNKLDAVADPAPPSTRCAMRCSRFAAAGRHRRWPASCRCRRCAATT